MKEDERRIHKESDVVCLRFPRCGRDGDDLLPTGKFNELGSVEHVKCHKMLYHTKQDAEPLLDHASGRTCYLY